MTDFLIAILEIEVPLYA